MVANVCLFCSIMLCNVGFTGIDSQLSELHCGPIVEFGYIPVANTTRVYAAKYIKYYLAVRPACVAHVETIRTPPRKPTGTEDSLPLKMYPSPLSAATDHPEGIGRIFSDSSNFLTCCGASLAPWQHICVQLISYKKASGGQSPTLPFFCMRPTAIHRSKCDSIPQSI